MPSSKKARFRDLSFLTIASTGFFVDGYLNTSIGLIMPMLGYTYFQGEDNQVPIAQADAIKASIMIGMISGQIFFGVLGDRFGRRRVYGFQILITITGTIFVALVPWGFSSRNLVTWVCVFRFITGIGIGADYPISATFSAEQNPFGSRAVLMAIVFASFGPGTMAAAIIFQILVSAFHGSIDSDPNTIQYVWRLLLLFGIIPALCIAPARFRMRETESFVSHSSNLPHDSNFGFQKQVQEFHNYFSQWAHSKVLIATAGVWFLFDIAFYGINLNQSIILSDLGFGDGPSPAQTLSNLAKGNSIVCALGFVPGFYAAIPLLDRLGRVRQQYLGCFIVATLYIACALTTEKLPISGRILLFAASQFFLNCGPSTTTFLLPAEVFPTRLRATGHGLSAATGKIGALVTTITFGSLTKFIGLPGTLILLSAFLVCAALLSFWIPEPKGKSLQDIETDSISYAPIPASSQENGGYSSEGNTSE